VELRKREMATQEEESKALAALNKIYEAVDIIKDMDSYESGSKGGNIWVKLDDLTNQLLGVFDKPGS